MRTESRFPGEQIPWEFVRAAMSSVADMAIIPMQDYLGLGSEARINIPSTLGTNWMWRMGERRFYKGACRADPQHDEAVRQISL